MKDNEFVEPTILGDNDRELFNKGIGRLEDMTSKLFEEGIPDDPRSVRLAKELIEASNQQLLKKAELNIKSKSNESAEKVNQTIIEIIKNKHKKNSNPGETKELETNISEDLVPDFELVEGQLELGHIPLLLDEVLENGTVEIDDEV